MTTEIKTLSYFEAADLATYVFFDNADQIVIDYVNPLNGYRSMCFNETLEQVQERYPAAVIMEKQAAYDAADRAANAKYTKAPEEITEERYMYAFEVLPPALAINITC